MLTRSLAVAVAVIVTAPVTFHPGTSAAAEPDGRELRGWSVELDRRATTTHGQRVRARHSFETVGVTWRGGDDPRVEVRARTDGQWTDWQELHPLVEGRRAVTEPVWLGTAQVVRVRVGEWRRRLSVVLVDAGENLDEPSSSPLTRSAAAARLGSATTLMAGERTGRRTERAPMPRLRLREDWGANERLRGTDPVYLDKIKQAHVHHTAGSNDYSRAEVPGIIRSMYWYHTKQLGWSDIGYNFLVDRFGRIWVGRAGGFRKRVRGAHTLGFNHASFGVAAIGNYDKARANERVKGALTRLVAWKLDRDDRAPTGRVTIYSKGSDRFPRGTRLRLPAVLSHRRTNQTACPGKALYEFIPRLRERAQARVDHW